MNRSEFEKLVQQSLRKLPRRFKQKLHNISIEIEGRPSQAMLRDLGLRNGELFGIYQGVPLTEREWNYGNLLPDRIVIFQHTIEAAAGTDEEIGEIVRDTVMHEIGHYFGFDDAYLYSIEDEKRKKQKTSPDKR